MRAWEENTCKHFPRRCIFIRVGGGVQGEEADEHFTCSNVDT